MSQSILSVYNFVLDRFHVDTAGGSYKELLTQMYLGVMSEYNAKMRNKKENTIG